MTVALILAIALVVGLFLGGLEWSRADKARAREQRRWDREDGATSMTWVLVPTCAFAVGLVIAGWWAR